jgi:hypothetical protein
VLCSTSIVLHRYIPVEKCYGVLHSAHRYIPRFSRYVVPSPASPLINHLNNPLMPLPITCSLRATPIFFPLFSIPSAKERALTTFRFCRFSLLPLRRTRRTTPVLCCPPVIGTGGGVFSSFRGIDGHVPLDCPVRCKRLGAETAFFATVYSSTTMRMMRFSLARATLKGGHVPRWRRSRGAFSFYAFPCASLSFLFISSREEGSETDELHRRRS